MMFDILKAMFQAAIALIVFYVVLCFVYWEIGDPEWYEWRKLYVLLIGGFLVWNRYKHFFKIKPSRY